MSPTKAPTEEKKETWYWIVLGVVGVFGVGFVIRKNSLKSDAGAASGAATGESSSMKAAGDADDLGETAALEDAHDAVL